MKNLLIKIALFVLRKHWVKSEIEANVTLPTYYWDIKELKVPKGKALTIKKIPRDFSELYFFPTIVSQILSCQKPSIGFKPHNIFTTDSFDLEVTDQNYEFKMVLKTTPSGELQESYLIDDQVAIKLK